MCGKEAEVKDILRNLLIRPVDATLCSLYQNTLLETINRNECIRENVTSEHIKTRQKVSCKLRKLEDRIESLETSSREIKAEVQDLRKLITDRSKRSQLIRETSAEIDNHRKDQMYTEIKAVTACIRMLDNSKVLILSGREGSGKSRNSLEILRQMKDNHPEIDVIKLTRLAQFTDIIDKDANTIILFEDVFGRITKQLSEDTDVQILDSLHSYIKLGNVWVIFVMRNTVKQECQSILSSHDIFCHSISEIDLNSKEFRLSQKEKTNIFLNYCKKSAIEITFKDMVSQHDPNEINIDKIKVNTIDKSVLKCEFPTYQSYKTFNKDEVADMIGSDPYIGFPECCRLFTKNPKFTISGAAFFKYHIKGLLQDIENLRIEGIDSDVKGLKYVILIYILLNQAPSIITADKLKFSLFPSTQLKIDKQVRMSIEENKTGVRDHKNLCHECYDRKIVVSSHIIKSIRKEMTSQFLIRKENKIYFQHRAVEDSVLISYIKINPTAIIPMLSIDHIVDIVRPRNYNEQEDEIVIKIAKPYYHILAKTIILLLDKAYSSCEQRIIERLLNSKLIKEKDNDLIYGILLFIKNTTNILSEDGKDYFTHFFSLYVLKNISDIDDSQVTVNHNDGEMVISVDIGNNNITFSIDPSTSLIHAFKDKYENIVKWLLLYTKHSLLDWRRIWSSMYQFYDLNYVQLVLRKVENHNIRMTMLIAKVIFQCEGEINIVDWMLQNVDNSLLSVYQLMYLVFGGEDYIKPDCYVTEVTLHILKTITPKIEDTNQVIGPCFAYGNPKLMKWVLDNFNHELLKKIKIIDLAIENYEHVLFFCETHQPHFENIFGQLLQIHGIEYSMKKRLIHIAIDGSWYDVLKLLFKHDIDTLNYIDTFIGKELIRWSNFVDSAASDDNNIFFSDDDYDEDEDDAEEEEDSIFGSVYRKSDEEKFLLLFLQRINSKFINFDNVMYHACHFGHSSPVLWLLKNKSSYQFDMRYIMNKVCFHGDLKLIRYLSKKYSADRFDYKSAMIKACRGHRTSTLPVCKWLWKNIDHSVFDMKIALNNASRFNNCRVIEWILADVGTFLDPETALHNACEHGSKYTVNVLLAKSTIKMFDIQSLISCACRNADDGCSITKLLLKRADKSTLDLNAVFSLACKCVNIDIVQLLIEIFAPSISEISHGNNIYSKNHVDINMLIDCILDMGSHESKKENETKSKLLMLILHKLDSKKVEVYKLLSECCKMDWVDIFQWILETVEHDILNIGEIVNIACQDGAFGILKWSLENVDLKLIDVNNVMVESCGYGWLECLVLVQKHCNQCDLQAAMVEACNYGHLHIVEWLLQNFYHMCLNPQLLMREAGRNGWSNIFLWLIDNYFFKTSNKLMATKEAIVNGKLGIVKLMFSRMSKSDFDISDLPEKTFTDSNNEEVVSFVLHHCDPIKLDISAIMINACKFGWTETVQYILDEKLFSSCDLNLAFAKACENGELEIVKALADKCHLQSLKMEKTIISVCIKGWDEVALFLLDKFEHTRLDIANALIEACRHGEIDVAQAILRKVKHTLLDVKTALDKACENHMHEELVLLILKNINQNQVDLKTVKKQAIRHKWREVQFAIPGVDTEDLNEAEQDTGTDFIVIS